ncbi:LPS assembly lipoprotein LptE [Geminisphaera colitermitum]|uniref:LPS assembly lipoprotein LptE n=1 Tax=Geminisphaera colitermitum TaxID=1148786 RepID=UPI000694F320|nr:LPS assembly lipoprotein LptE [Geminisphaera colitermitum]
MRIHLSRLFAPFAAAALVLFSLAGCSHYQLGTNNRVKFDTLYIAPVGNSAALPQAQAVVTTQLRETFLRDGRVILVNTPEDADAILKVDLSNYSRNTAVSRRDDTGLARKFDVTLRARVTLLDNKEGGKPIFTDRRLEAVRQLYTDDGQQLQAEYQLLPLLAETLAEKVRGSVLDTW